ncbi:MAG: ABC transporter ATP-binding protein, partial [Jaaginema sp. PMC 1079.18]|nr:ABC transporter ATP-binding protein [Jaaginema sp. PMC 1079.18]
MIEVEALSKTYGSQRAIDNVSFAVNKGEILGFLGPNGAGKTTTMRILAGYLPASSGTAKVAGFDVETEAMAVRKAIGYLPESPPLYLDMTVKGYLHFVAKIKGVSRGDRAAYVDSALKRCSIEDKRNVLCAKLSKGYRQRVGIAQAIVHNPPVIILDEPTIGLDPRQIIEVRHLIRSLAGKHTIILSTHILPEVSMTCDRVTIIDRGQVVATNTPDRLMTQLNEAAGYHLEVEGNLTPVQPLLQAIPGVQNVEILPIPDAVSSSMIYRQQSFSRLQIIAKPGSEPGRAIASTLVNAGLGLYEMRRIRPTLEDVFLQLTMQDNLAPSPHEENISDSRDTEMLETPPETNSVPEFSDRESPEGLG